MKVIEIGGKTLVGRQRREWHQGQETAAYSKGFLRSCKVVRFAKHDSSRVLIRWTEDAPFGGILTGKTQWVGLYDVRPELS